MLRLLRIENLVLARDVELEFGAGLNLITGETGAGKSLIGGAIGLALAARAETGMVRQGEDRAVVEALFELGDRDEAIQRVRRQGLTIEAGELLIRRELSVDGRSKATANGATVTIAMLRELTSGLVEVHGQSESQSLLQPDFQRTMIDRFESLDELLVELRKLHTALRENQSRMQDLLERQSTRAAREESIRFRLSEIEQLKPQLGEEAQLRAERERLRHAASISESLQAALEGLYEADGSAIERIHAAARRVRSQGAHDEELLELADRIDEQRAALQECAQDLRERLEQLGGDPAQLGSIEDRLAALDRLRRRFDGAPLDEIVSNAIVLERELEELQAQTDASETLAQERAQLREQYRQLAERLSQRRKAASMRLAEQVSRLLADLAMKHARVEVHFDLLDLDQAITSAAGAEGLDQLELLLAANPGEPARPLRKVASGGELSRVMLALDIALEAGMGRRTLLFDEVDQGLGGEAADRLGEMLTRVARHHQVICITHLPQVAARADVHVHVSKKLKAGRTVAVVKTLEDTEDRVEELARMLSGSIVSETARRHAESLIRPNRDRGAQPV
jgi:DNA repair protein RecN (Recombination protein N)